MSVESALGQARDALPRTLVRVGDHVVSRVGAEYTLEDRAGQVVGTYPSVRGAVDAAVELIRLAHLR